MRILKPHTSWIVAVLILVGTGAASAGSPGPNSTTQGNVDFSDTSSAALTARAWTALANRDFAAVAAYTGKCRELYETDAKRQQSGLTAFIPSVERERILSLWALNDVAVCYLIAGQSQEIQSDEAAAVALYRALNERFSYAQCWDSKGWFWRPAEVARTRLYHLEFEAASR